MYKSKQKYNYILENEYFKKVLTTKVTYGLIVIFTLSLVFLKLYGFILSTNLIFLCLAISSITAVLTMLIFVLMPRIKYYLAIIRITQVIYVLSGFAIFFLGLDHILNPSFTMNYESSVLLVIFICLLQGTFYLSIQISSLVNHNLVLRILGHTIQRSILDGGIVIIVIIGEILNFTLIQGIIVFSYGFALMIEARKISLNRYTEHILVSLNTEPLSKKAIFDIDKRIAMLFGAPMFFNEVVDTSHTFWNEVGIELLLNQNLIHLKDDLYELTPEGKVIADKKSRDMIRFLKFITKLTKPTISPILSLILHIFMGSLKLFGFVVTGSVGLLGDGLDSAIDGISSIIVSIAMRINREKQATYLLLSLMVITATTILFSSLERIITPTVLNEEIIAVMIAVLSIILCSSLYFYQRYSGYVNQNLVILAQSADSKNHVLNAVLVLIAIVGSIFQIYIFDGIVGCFISFLIFKGAYELYQDLKISDNGEKIDFEKYQLSVVKGYSRFRSNLLNSWIIFELNLQAQTLESLEKKFCSTFSPFTFRDSTGNQFLISYPYEKSDLTFKLQKLETDGLIVRAGDQIMLTATGIKKIQKAIRSFKHG